MSERIALEKENNNQIPQEEQSTDALRDELEALLHEMSISYAASIM